MTLRHADRRPRHRRYQTTAALVIVFVTSGTIAAQRQAAKAVPLEFRQMSDVANGRVAALEGEVDEEGLRFGIGDLSVLQPVEIWLAASDPSQPVGLEVTKFGFDGVLKEATTGSDGAAVLRFRSELGVTLGVKAKAPRAAFQLVAWVGDELQTTPATILTPRRAASGPDRWPLIGAVAGIALAALVVVGFFRVRRSK